jgi:glucose/arabinose dehydrogenase
MTNRNFPIRALSPLLFALASCGAASPGEKGEPTSTPSAASAQPFKTEVIATFDQPWAAARVADTPYLIVTERGGTIKLVDATNRVYPVAGAPKVDFGGQGGLGDVAFAPGMQPVDGAFPIYLSWAEAGSDDTRGAVVGRGLLVIDEMDGASEIKDLKVIWRQSPKVTGRGHYSHRIAFSPDGRYLFVSSGERQKFTPAQDLSGNLGKVVRLNLDGTPAAGNAFTGQAGRAQDIWSYGHRNVLGLDFDAQGRLWDLEHGPAGGDELNLVERGRNYGWPLVSNGDNYDGTPIPRHNTRPDLAAPAISWNPVIAPGDFLFYKGSLFPWRGQAIVTAMKPGGLVRVGIDGTRATELARYPMERRIREVVEAADGALWLLEDGKGGRLLRLTPN